ncbi:MAG: hypothetical protein GY722_16500 [bacterium]|nr:hypothetical protein [bacterium]
MENIKQRSLEELEELYQKKVQHWEDRRLQHLKQAKECEQQVTLFEQKLRHIKALVNGPEAVAAAPQTITVKLTGKRRRKSPIRDATLLVLRNRPGQKLTAAQIKTAIRKDTHRRCTRQAVNVNLNTLARAGLVKRARAPKGAGAQFVYWAV